MYGYAALYRLYSPLQCFGYQKLFYTKRRRSGRADLTAELQERSNRFSLTYGLIKRGHESVFRRFRIIAPLIFYQCKRMSSDFLEWNDISIYVGLR